MNIVHFSITPLAGGPYRLVSTLNKLTELNVRLIDLKRWGRYPQDIIFEESVDEAVDVVSGADIIHFHNYISLDTDVFNPIDFREFQKKGVGLLRQFRTSPTTLEINTGVPVEKILSPDIPSIVIAQFHERYYPNARVVPNAVPSQQQEYMPGTGPDEFDICYTPSNLSFGWSSRWDTKGGPETIMILREIEREKKIKNVVVSGKPLNEVLEKKKKSKIVIDDLLTGSYHASGLEGLCMAKTVLCYLDNRTVSVLKEVSGSDSIPFVNTRLEEAKEVVIDLLEDNDLVTSIGQLSRKWIDIHWSEEVIADRYVQIYENLLKDPELVNRQEKLRIDGPIRKYFEVSLHEHIYYTRGKNFYKSLTLKEKINIYFKKNILRIRRKIKNNTPVSVLNWYKKGKMN